MTESIDSAALLKKLEDELVDKEERFAKDKRRLEELKDVIEECEVFTTNTEKLQEAFFFLIQEYTNLSELYYINDYSKMALTSLKFNADEINSRMKKLSKDKDKDKETDDQDTTE